MPCVFYLSRSNKYYIEPGIEGGSGKLLSHDPSVKFQPVRLLVRYCDRTLIFFFFNLTGIFSAAMAASV